MKFIFSLFLTIAFLTTNVNAQNFFEKLFTLNEAEKKAEGFSQLDLAIKSLSEQILKNNNLKQTKNIAITSIVKLDSLNKTSSFGRTISESLINELHSKKFKIIDIRANENLSINNEGEYFLSRDINKISQKHGDINVLVGTYSKFEYDNVVINLRILNSITAEVLSTATVVYYYDDCELLDLCTDGGTIKVMNK